MAHTAVSQPRTNRNTAAPSGSSEKKRRKAIERRRRRAKKKRAGRNQARGEEGTATCESPELRPLTGSLLVHQDSRTTEFATGVFVAASYGGDHLESLEEVHARLTQGGGECNAWAEGFTEHSSASLSPILRPADFLAAAKDNEALAMGMELAAREFHSEHGTYAHLARLHEMLASHARVWPTAHQHAPRALPLPLMRQYTSEDASSEASVAELPEPCFTKWRIQR